MRTPTNDPFEAYARTRNADTVPAATYSPETPAPIEGHAQAAPHREILRHLLTKVRKIDFRKVAELDSDSEKLQKKHFLVIAIEETLRLARAHGWRLCLSGEHLYLYNGAYWVRLDPQEVQVFLAECAEKMGIDKFDARLHTYREQLYEQFLAVAYLPPPDPPADTVLINLKNGTLEITGTGARLRDFRPDDFMTYQLPFDYAPRATAPMFDRYLTEVLPDDEKRSVLAEFLAYVFIKPSFLKLEKALILYGTGANGKSVFFEIVEALLGRDNIANCSLKSLTDDKGYSRAKIVGKLVNYASEINASLEAAMFKALVSGEPVEARLPYGQPFSATDYGKLIFNCNVLPRDVEHSDAYFRRFLIVHFDRTIPEDRQDKGLARKIKDAELSGILNWVLAGLDRLLSQRNFSECKSSRETVARYRRESDSVQMFLEEHEYVPATDRNQWETLKDFYGLYRAFCIEDGYKVVSKKTFKDRLTALRFEISRHGNYGNIVKAVKKSGATNADSSTDAPF